MRSILDIITIRCHNPKNEIYVYDSNTGLYEEFGHSTLEWAISSILGDLWKTRYAREVINHIISKTYINRKDFDAPIRFVPVENGVLDLRKNPVEFLPFDKKYYFTKKLPAKYDPKADCPTFKKCLNEILLDETSRLQIQEMFGWCLWRDYKNQALFLLAGGGGNGKGTLLTALIRLLGTDNICAVSLETLGKNRFAGADFYHKFANVSQETSQFTIKDTSLMKSLTGEDRIRAEWKHVNAFYFDNYAKLISAVNSVPYTNDHSDAFYRRPIIVFFKVRFGFEKTDVLKDKDMRDKITTPEELSGILNWAIEGLQRLNKQGDFTGRLTIEENRKYYQKLLSPILSYIDIYLIEADENAEIDYIPRSMLLEKIEKYCEKNDLIKKDISYKHIKSSIKKHYPEYEMKQITVTYSKNPKRKKRIRVWSNCCFKENVDNADVEEYVDSLFEGS